jgi:hypothetical protein
MSFGGLNMARQLPVAQVCNLCLRRPDACATGLSLVLRDPGAHERLT